MNFKKSVVDQLSKVNCNSIEFCNFNIHFCASILQMSICSSLLLMNLAIHWDLLIPMSLELWCTLTTHIRIQKLSNFRRRTSEEFRSYMVNSWWNLIFKKKTYWGTGLTPPDCKGLIILPKRKKVNKLGKNQLLPTLPTHYAASVACSHCNPEETKQQCMACCSVLPHSCILPSTSVALALQMSSSSEWRSWQERRSTAPLTKFSKGRNSSATGEHN